jgi:hypothetical protein
LVAHDRSIAAKSFSELCGISAEVRVETALSGRPWSARVPMRSSEAIDHSNAVQPRIAQMTF